MKYKNSFYCFEKNNRFYAIDTERIIPMRVDKATYEILDKIDMGKCSFEELIESETNPKYKTFAFLKDCDLLFHDQKQCYVKNSFKELNLSVIPTLGCNLNCKYCYSHVKDSNREVSVETVKQAILFFCENYAFNYCRMDFVSGGEPLLTQDKLKQIVNQIKTVLNQYGKKSLMWLCTNGTLLNEDILKFLDENDFKLGISLDGQQIVNDMNRVFKNGNGTYTCIQQNIRDLLNNPKLTRKIKYLWNSAVISSATKSLVDVIDNAYNMGFSNLQMKLVWSNQDNLRLTIERAIEMYKELTEYLFTLVTKGDMERFLMFCNENDTYGKILLRIIIQSGVTRRCNAGLNKFSLSYDGKLYPCDSFLGNEEYCIGDIYHGFNEKYDQINQLRVESNGVCRECWARFLCGGDCFYHSLLNTSRINEPDEKTCRITKELIKMGCSLIVDLYEAAPENMKNIYNILSKRTRSLEPKYGND